LSAATHLDHFYAVLGDGRLNILASKPALEQVASTLRTLAPSETRFFSLTVVDAPHYGPTFPSLRCARTEKPLRCVVEQNTVVIAGHSMALKFLATTLDDRAQEWLDGGHAHVYPGEIDRSENLADGENDRLVSDDSEELLIGGHGYIDDKFFGLPPTDSE
jgi:hypothetical protein